MSSSTSSTACLILQSCHAIIMWLWLHSSFSSLLNPYDAEIYHRFLLAKSTCNSTFSDTNSGILPPWHNQNSTYTTVENPYVVQAKVDP